MAPVVFVQIVSLVRGGVLDLAAALLIRLATMVGSWHQDPEGEGPRRSRRRAESLPA